MCALLQFDLRKNIPQHDFCLVSDAYAQQKIVEPSHFRRVLFQLGISDCIQVPKRELILSPADKPQSPWVAADLGDAPQGNWVLQDFACEEFEAVVQSVLASMDDSQSLRSLQYLAEMVSAQWAAHYSHNLTAACTSRSGRYPFGMETAAWKWRLAAGVYPSVLVPVFDCTGAAAHLTKRMGLDQHDALT